MENNHFNPLKDFTSMCGLIFVACSSLFFFIAEWHIIPIQNNFGWFCMNYIFTGLYFLVMMIDNFKKHGRSLLKIRQEYVLLFLILGLFSAFALNRDINVFNKSEYWLEWYLSISTLSVLLYCFRQYLPDWLQYPVYFILGAGLLMYLYFSVYLLPLYLVGLVAFFVLGLSLHIFMPLGFLIQVIILARKSFLNQKVHFYSLLAGFVFPLLFGIYFIGNFVQIQQKIAVFKPQNAENFTAASGVIIPESRNLLPEWIQIAQQLPDNWLTEKVLKTDLVYMGGENIWGRQNFNLNFGEVRKHDPLLLLATVLSPKDALSLSEKTKILATVYDARHKTQERLWSGKDLITSNILTQVEIFPTYRLAYTEKTLQIENTYKNGWQQEAIYTFFLPEGGVVTLLSLWINGKEEKAMLTTKAKADTAYKTIVGVESRDPSVIHWQEGNTVSVRVFPCTPQEKRKFKIGITSPLRKKKNQLVYENIYFQGPDASSASDSAFVYFKEGSKNLILPEGFEKQKEKYFSAGKFRPYWEIYAEATALSDKSFSFGGKSYHIKDYKPDYQHVETEAIYLDINAAWTEAELEKVWEVGNNKSLYVFDEKIIKLTETNRKEIFNKLYNSKFSLFPFYEISEPDKALVISKSSGISPQSDDLKGSLFAERLYEFLPKHQPIRLFNLGNELSPYLKTLKELRVFQYEATDILTLAERLKTGKFIRNPENEQVVFLESANVLLSEIPATLTDNKNVLDHLLRLFAYNDVLKKIGKNYFTDNFVTDSLIAEAEKAYVVTPVSSLLVLETQQDYERFDIKKSKDSLQNASINSSGAVPEPHEWALIVITVLVMSYYVYRQNFSK
ncbi:MAG: XrtN system VIT domain-containing protein [Verrucomicrobia bacterium]|nr:XrtN system VIT domain-containing protein [Cytophagales bacterium]